MKTDGKHIISDNINSSYRTEIDGLRALAVIAVIINHTNKDILPSGYLGVDIFFVISGFVITSSLISRQSKNFGDFLLNFFTRRIKRLLPALVLFVLITSLLICIFDENPIASLRTGLASLFGLSNLYMYKQASDYFGSSVELNVFTHTWSLGVEEQFYFLFPCLVWFSGYGKFSITRGRNLFFVMLFLSVTSLISYINLFESNQPAAYFLMPTRLWELGSGCLLFLGIKYNNKFFLNLKSAPPLLVIAVILGIFFTPLRFAIEATIAIVVMTVILISCLRSGTSCYDFFTSERVVYIGKISYSLYLWHWGVLSLSRWTTGVYWWSVPFQVALMLIFAIASYHYVEVPLRQIEWSSKRWKSIGYGFGASTISAMILVILLSGGGNLLYSGSKSSNSENHTRDKIVVEKKDGTIFLIGDSHAGHFVEMIDNVANELKMKFSYISAPATPFPTLNISTPVGGVTLEKNQIKNKEILLNIDKNLTSNEFEEKNLIILSSFYKFYFETPLGSRRFQVITHYTDNGVIITQTEALNKWLKDLETFADKHKKTNIVIILSTPEMPGIYPLQLCKKEWFRSSLSDKCYMFIARSEVVESLNRLNSKLRETASRSRNIFVFDPTPSLCPAQDGYCKSHFHENRLYLDEDHLTEYGNHQVKGDFLAFVAKNKLL
jgi:peptidoglycan/LPS O-acetylase OafA/YrhL